MLEEGQVNQNGDQGESSEQSLGWRAALPDEFKNHDYVKTFTKPGDFVKAALEAKTERDTLNERVKGAIFKPDDKSTPEQREEFYRSLGKPEKPTEYEFPKGEGVEHDPKLTEWAQGIFHQANLNKEQASVISTAWDKFIQGVAQAQAEAAKNARAEAETKIKAEMGDKYPAAVELTRRFIEKYAKPEELQFLDESGLGNHPILIRMIVDFAQKTGEDTGLIGEKGSGEKPKIGMNYNTMPDFSKGG
jgi:hypothetical protein